MPSSKSTATRAFFGLSDETRLRVVRVMATMDASTRLTELASVLDVEQSKLSKHIQTLVWAGLLTQSRVGRTIALSLAKVEPHLQTLYAAVMALEDATGTFSKDLARFISEQGRNAAKN
jgi:DNA-binding transcriptional ArsR family regulator